MTLFLVKYQHRLKHNNSKENEGRLNRFGGNHGSVYDKYQLFK